MRLIDLCFVSVSVITVILFICYIARIAATSVPHLLETIEQFGGWPMLNDNWNNTELDLTTLLGNLVKNFDTDVFFQLTLTPDPKNRKINRLTVCNIFLSQVDL